MQFDFNRFNQMFGGLGLNEPGPFQRQQQAEDPSRQIARAPQLHRDPLRIADNSALSQLKALGPRLTLAQRQSIAYLEKYKDQRNLHSNAELYRNLDTRNATEDEMHALLRRPSFLLVSPILEEMQSTVPNSPAEMTAPMTRAAKLTLTAQTAVLREQIKAQQAVALAQAQSGMRLRPLTLDQRNFMRFIDSQRPQLRQAIRACGLPPAQREPILEETLTRIAKDYLSECNIETRPVPVIVDGVHGLLPAVEVGLLPGSSLPMHAAIPAGPQRSVYGIGLFADGIDDLARDPQLLGGSAFGMSTAFINASVPERTASVFLQNLFFELAGIEQNVVLERALARNELDMGSPAFKTGFEKAYDGAEILGDQCHSDPAESANGPSQREKQLAPLGRLQRQAAMYQRANGMPVLVDAEVNQWVRGPEFERDLASMAYPGKRLEFLQMTQVDEALRASGVFTSLAGRI